MTVSSSWVPESLGLFVGVGIALAVSPFGGFHNLRAPWVVIFLLSALLNAVIWGMIVGVVAEFFKRVLGRARAG
jgi:flagellar biosynthesis protein FliR